MAHFYGRIQGNRGEATRCGSKNSGINATVESWSTILRTRQNTLDGSDRAAVTLTTKHGLPLFRGVFDAERVSRHRSNPKVQKALREVEQAFDNLDRVALDIKDEEAVAAYEGIF